MRHIADALQSRLDVDVTDVKLAENACGILSGLTRQSLNAEGDRLCRVVEEADLLVIGSPVYRASYTGILKHLFDLVSREALSSKVAVLASTGGSPMHALMIEHQLRPLAAFFRMRAVETSIYATEDEVLLDGSVSVGIAARIERAADEAARNVVGGMMIAHAVSA